MKIKIHVISIRIFNIEFFQDHPPFYDSKILRTNYGSSANEFAITVETSGSIETEYAVETQDINQVNFNF